MTVLKKIQPFLTKQCRLVLGLGSIGPHGIRCCFYFLSHIGLSEICDALPRGRSTKLRKSQVT